jgi:hypothetical protein
LENIKNLLLTLKEHLMLVLAALLVAAGFVVKLLLNRNAELKAENVAAEEKGQLKELKNEDVKQTAKSDGAVKSYEQLRDEYLRK